MKHWSPLSAALGELDLSGMKAGRVAPNAKILKVLMDNQNNPKFEKGLMDYTRRLGQRGGNVNPLSVWMKSVWDRLDQLGVQNPKARDINKAVKWTIEQHIFPEQRKLENTFKRFSSLTGRPENTARWKKFKNQTGFTGSEDDFARMVRMHNDEIEYTDKNGTKWLLDIEYVPSKKNSKGVTLVEGHFESKWTQL